jgi:hypothetical protein
MELLLLVLEVGLEPTEPYGGRFTVSCDCHYTIPARLEPPLGFEPRTYCLQNSCSNQLS